MKIFGISIGNKYGKQIGKTSVSGLQTFVKTNKNDQKIYTTVDAKTKDVVRTKRFSYSEGEHSTSARIDTFDKTGDLISRTERYERYYVLGVAVKNKFAKKINRYFKTFNKFGQVLDRRASTFTQAPSKPRAFLDKNINGHISKTYIDTTTFPTKTIRTIDCVE